MTTTPATRQPLLDRLDQFPPARFVAVLYLLRWCALVPVMIAQTFLGGQSTMRFNGDPLLLLVGFLFIAPVLETLVECALPWFILSRFTNPMPARPWLFITISAIIMALLHPELAAVIPALVTGAFLAYCYAHFAPRAFSRALLWTWLFHASINLVGWLLLFVF